MKSLEKKKKKRRPDHLDSFQFYKEKQNNGLSSSPPSAFSVFFLFPFNLTWFCPSELSSATLLWAFSPRERMPDQISVSEFISETTEDYNSPTTSSFTTRLQSCRNSVNVLEEVRPRCQPASCKLHYDGWMDG